MHENTCSSGFCHPQMQEIMTKNRKNNIARYIHTIKLPLDIINKPIMMNIGNVIGRMKI